MESRSSNWQFSHPGVYVKDFNKTLDYYVNLGIAVRPVRPARPAATPPVKRPQVITKVFGRIMPPPPPPDPSKTTEPSLELLYIGDLELEVLRAPLRPPATRDYLTYGEGINHVCFNVPDIDGETAKLVDKSCRIIFDLTIDDKRFEDYLDTRLYGNVILSLRPLQSEEAKAWKASLGIVDWKFRGHGVAVRDVDRTAEYYQSLGIAAVQPEATFDSSSIADFKVYGTPPETTVKARTRTAQVGPVVYEFIQPLEGEAIYREYLDRRGEGIIDLTFTVDDLDRETARLVEKGVPVILSGKPQTGGAFACFDTREDGGDIMIRLIQAE